MKIGSLELFLNSVWYVRNFTEYLQNTVMVKNYSRIAIGLTIYQEEGELAFCSVDREYWVDQWDMKQASLCVGVFMMLPSVTGS